MEAFLKERYGTARAPKRQRTAADGPTSARSAPPPPPQVVVPAQNTAQGYLNMFCENEVLAERTMLALHHAARAGDAAAVAQLPEVAPTPLDYNAAGYLGLTALQHAVFSKEAGTVACVLRGGASQQAFGCGISHALGAPQWGCLLPALPHLRCRCSAGGKVDAVAVVGESALHHAAGHGCGDITKALLAAGADVDLRDSAGRTALHHAATGGYLDTAQALLRAGADVNVVDAAGQSALYHAAGRGNLDTVAALLDAGADVHLRAMHHLPTALHVALHSGHAEVAELLESHGASRHGLRAGFTRGASSGALTERQLQQSMLEGHGVSQAQFSWLLMNAAVTSGKECKTAFTFLRDGRRIMSRAAAADEIRRRMAASAAATAVPADRGGALGTDIDGSEGAAGGSVAGSQLQDAVPMDVDTQAAEVAGEAEKGARAAAGPKPRWGEKCAALVAGGAAEKEAPAPAPHELPWAEKYAAAEKVVRAAGRWPADGQPLRFLQGGAGVSEQERRVAQRRLVSTSASFLDSSALLLALGRCSCGAGPPPVPLSRPFYGGMPLTLPARSSTSDSRSVASGAIGRLRRRPGRQRRWSATGLGSTMQPRRPCAQRGAGPLVGRSDSTGKAMACLSRRGGWRSVSW
jgi:hypothetical protein